MTVGVLQKHINKTLVNQRLSTAEWLRSAYSHYQALARTSHYFSKVRFHSKGWLSIRCTAIIYITELPFHSAYGLHSIFPAQTPPPESMYTTVSHLQLSEAAHQSNSMSKGRDLLQWYYFLEKEGVLGQDLQNPSLCKRFFSTS